MNGPFKAGTNNVTIFSKKGPKQKPQEAGKRGIGDEGYSEQTTSATGMMMHIN
jgi:hypothetical protein